eukprot:1161110-Pelagomonas_calceolata.AAC.13
MLYNIMMCHILSCLFCLGLQHLFCIYPASIPSRSAASILHLSCIYSVKTADDMTPFTHLACTAAFVHHHEQDLVAGMDFPKARHAPYVTMLPEKYM